LSMASRSLSSLLGSSDETFNGTKLMRLILDGGTEALRNAFQKTHPGNLQVVLSCTCSSTTYASSTCNHHILSNLKSRKIINQNQWGKLYPAPPNHPNIKDFDITLLSVLLRSICSLSPPCSGWDKMPNITDHSVEADIIRIRLFRNERFGHIPNTAVSTADFKIFWKEIELYFEKFVKEALIEKLSEPFSEKLINKVMMNGNISCGNFLGTTDAENVLTVYDLTQFYQSDVENFELIKICLA
ncbi:Hypothetical predicted protein, partial [Paramuricea clavata]